MKFSKINIFEPKIAIFIVLAGLCFTTLYKCSLEHNKKQDFIPDINRSYELKTSISGLKYKEYKLLHCSLNDSCSNCEHYCSNTYPFIFDASPFLSYTSTTIKVIEIKQNWCKVLFKTNAGKHYTYNLKNSILYDYIKWK